MRKLVLFKVMLLGLVFFAKESKAQLINLVDPSFLVNSPATVAGTKSFTYSSDGTTGWGRVIDSFWYNIPLLRSPSDTIGCTSLPGGSLNGSFALIYRGTCQFSEKAYTAQLAGAMGIVIVNNVAGGPVGMAAGNNAALVTIPVLMISKEDGDILNALIINGQPVNVSLTNWGFGFTDDLGLLPYSQPLFHNSAIPASQIKSTITPYAGYTGTFIGNFGSNTQTDIKIMNNVSFTPTGGSPTLIHSDSVILSGSFSAIDSVIDLIGTDGYSLPGIAQTGVIDFDYSLSADLPDEQTGNNSAKFKVFVTDSVFSKGRIDAITQEPLTTVGYRFNNSSTQIWGPLYFIKSGQRRAYRSQFTVSAGTGNQLDGKSVSIFVFKWVDASADKLIQEGELELKGLGSKSFGPADSSFSVFTINYQSLEGNSLILDSNSWYWVGAEVAGDMFLGCDGELNYFMRSLAANSASTPVVEYWAPQFQGTQSDVGSNPGNALRHFPFFNADATIDSIGFTGSKGLVPSITLHTSKGTFDPTGIKDFSKNKIELKIFPNPATDYLYADVKSESKNYEVTVIDGLGKIIYKSVEHKSQSPIKVNTKSFQSGNYYLVIKTDKDEITAKQFTIVRQ